MTKQESTDFSRLWVRFLEPTIVLAFLTYSIYLFSMVYNEAYFGALSVPNQNMGLFSARVIPKLIPIFILNMVIFLGIAPVVAKSLDLLFAQVIYPLIKSYVRIIRLSKTNNRDPIQQISLAVNKKLLKMYLNKYSNFYLDRLESRRHIIDTKRRTRDSIILASFLVAYILSNIFIYKYKIIFFDIASLSPLQIFIPRFDGSNFFIDLQYNFLNMFIVYMIIIYLILLLFFSAFSTYHSICMLCDHPAKKIIYLAILLSIIFYFNFGIINDLGNYDARRLVEGCSGSYEIKMNLDNSSLNLINNTYMLVMQYEGSYYLVEKKKPAPPQSSLYIVPLSKIRDAKITRIPSSNNFKLNLSISHSYDNYNLNSLFAKET